MISCRDCPHLNSHIREQREGWCGEIFENESARSVDQLQTQGFHSDASNPVVHLPA